VENAHDLIVVIQDKKLKFTNPKATDVFGYTQDNFVHLTIDDIVHPDDRGMIQDIRLKATRGMNAGLSYHMFRVYTKHGELLWMQVNVVPIEWEGTQATLCLMRDITEARKLEAQLFQAQKMQAIGTLAGGVAHDFNNILSAIIGHTELCKIKIGPGQEIHRNLDHIFNASQRARDLVNQILTFSRQKDKELKPIEIRYPVSEALKLLKATIPSNIVIREKIVKDSGIVVSDATQIHQIIMNLCTNAAHAMEEKGGTLDVSTKIMDLDNESSGMVRNLKPGHYVCLTVSDTGHGMPQAVVDRIFEPYFTTKKQGQGTGLGLAMIHGIVASISGVINVYSEPGAGSTFNIYLPRVVSQTEPIVNNADMVPVGTENVLLVDDEEVVLDMTREILVNLGYTVTSRASSIEALNFFKADPHRIDAVITDQTMPNLTGKELAERILEIRPEIPIILSTGFSATINEERAMEIGIKAFVRKPVLRADLAATVRRILDESRMAAPRGVA
jgi:PAS domain S-box-containing protein